MIGKEVNTNNIENQEKLKKSRLYVLETHIYTQKMPFTYTVLTKEGLKALVFSLIIGVILEKVIGKGMWEAYSLACYIGLNLWTYKRKINISYSDINKRVYLIAKAQELFSWLRDETRKNRLNSIMFSILLLTSLFTSKAYCSMQSAVEDFNKQSDDYLTWYEDEEKENKLQKKSEELKKMKSSKFKQLKLDEAILLIEKEIQLKSLED